MLEIHNILCNTNVSSYVHTIDDDSHFPRIFPLTKYFYYLTFIGYDNHFDSSNHYTWLKKLPNLVATCL